MDIFDLSSRHADWLAMRRNLVAGNVANMNTPGYRTRETTTFAAYLDTVGHASIPGRPDRSDKISLSKALASVDTGESVTPGPVPDLDVEMLKSGDIARQHSLNTAIVRSYHRMLLSAVK